MKEELQPRRPITALRRCETDLALLRIEVRRLAAQVGGLDQRLSECREDLERLAALFEREFSQREEDLRE